MKNGLSTEDKLLLIKDLSARLPYAVTVEHTSGFRGTLHNITIHHMYDDDDNIYDAICYTDFFGDNDDIYIEYFKPYLFPMSSMTEEQQNEFDRTYANDMQVVSDNLKDRLDGQPYEMNLGHYRHIDWCNTHHFDYRGLIEKGLANDATGLNVY